MNFLRRPTILCPRTLSWIQFDSRRLYTRNVPFATRIRNPRKPQLWLNELAANVEWYADGTREMPAVTLQTLHQLIREKKLAMANRVRQQLEDMGVDIPHDIFFITAAFGELDTLSPATFEDFYAWLRLIPHREEVKSDGLYGNPFTRFETLYCAGSLNSNLTAAFMMAKIASSKGYFLGVFKRFMPFIARTVTPDIGLEILMELEKLAVEYELQMSTQHATQQARQLIRSSIVRACCQANWLQEASSVIKASDDVEIFPQVRRLFERKISLVRASHTKSIAQSINLFRKLQIQRALLLRGPKSS